MNLSVMSPLLRISNHDDKMTCGQSSSSESLNTTGVWGWFNFVIFLNSNLVDVIQAARDLRFRLWPDDVIQTLTRWCYSGCPRSRREKGCSCDNLSPDCCHQLLLQDWMDWGDIFFISFKVAIRVGQSTWFNQVGWFGWFFFGLTPSTHIQICDIWNFCMSTQFWDLENCTP